MFLRFTNFIEKAPILFKDRGFNDYKSHPEENKIQPSIIPFYIVIILI